MKKKSYLATTSAKAFNFRDVETDKVNLLQFENEFHRWVHSSIQDVKGLPKKKYIVSGVTDAFNQLYGLYNKIGIFEGEYGYHKKVLGDRVTYDFREADCIVISHPFSADGNCSHEKLKEANSYGVPIFVDCALFGVCKGINFDFKPYKNVTSVCFSLSKVFGTGLRRVGLLYTKEKFPCTVYADWQYPLVSSAEYHYNLLSTVGPDDLPNKYEREQTKVCRWLEIKPSSTVIFGLDYTDRYANYKRGDVNRICITNYLESENYKEGFIE